MKSGKTCEIMWVHTAARGRGLGKLIKSASHVVPESEGFWKACGVPYTV